MRFPRSPGLAAAAVAAYLAALLALDRYASYGEQLALGALTFLVLAAACSVQPAERRVQVAVVVAVATCFEVIGSVLWGVYSYRLGNLPLFVPPAHGLVYLGGYALSRTALARRAPRLWVGAALAGSLGWGIAGVTVLPRVDAIGAFGILVFSVFLLRGRAPAVLAGVFAVVAGLEIYGTVLGTWQWAEVVPGLGLPNGNPPSGAVSGYVLFDLVAFALATRLLAAAARLRTAMSPTPMSELSEGQTP